MRVVIIGPMRGRPRYNFDAFAQEASRLRSLGHEVFNPAEADMDAGFNPDDPNTIQHFDTDAALERNLNAIARADAVQLLKGYSRSRLAPIELCVAITHRKHVFPPQTRLEAAAEFT